MDMGPEGDGIQAETDSRTEDTGSEVYWTTFAWYQSLSWPGHGGTQEIIDWYPGFTDDIYVSVYTCTVGTNDIAWTGSLQACFYLEDVTTSTGNYYHAPIDGDTFQGHSIYWIQERSGAQAGECDGYHTQWMEEMPTFTSYGMTVYAQGGGYGDLNNRSMTVDGTSATTVMANSEFLLDYEQVNIYFDNNGSEYCWHFD